MMDDITIVELYWRRDEEAITASHSKYGGYCHTIAYNILNNALDADECVSDTWLRSWNVMPPQRPRILSAFFGKITRNLSLDRWRRETAEKRGGSRTETALEELANCIPANMGNLVDDLLLTACLERFLRGLPQKKRNIFLRRYWYLDSVEEIAADYRMTRSGVASMLRRMRLELKLQLEREGIVL